MLCYFPGFPHSSVGKESTCNAGEPCLMPGLERSPGEGVGYPLQYSWASLVVQTVKNLPVMWETWVRSLCWGDPLEEDMATHSSIRALQVALVVKTACSAGDVGSIPGTKIPWRRTWLPTPVFLPGKFHGQRSLAHYSPWAHKQLDTAEHTWELLINALEWRITLTFWLFLFSCVKLYQCSSHGVTWLRYLTPLVMRPD